MRTYISGKINGLELDQAKQKFQKAEELLHSINLRPVNPIKLGLRCTDSLNDQIARDIELLLSCKAVLMLSNWRESKESRIERRVAHETNKIILFERNESKHYDLIQTVEGAIHEVTGKEVAQNIHDKRVEKEILKTPSLKSDIVRTSNKASRVLWSALNTIKHKTMGVAYIQHTGNAKEEVTMNHINNLNDPKLFEWFDVDEKGVCYLNDTAKEQLNDYFNTRAI